MVGWDGWGDWKVSVRFLYRLAGLEAKYGAQNPLAKDV